MNIKLISFTKIAFNNEVYYYYYLINKDYYINERKWGLKSISRAQEKTQVGREKMFMGPFHRKAAFMQDIYKKSKYPY